MKNPIYTMDLLWRGKTIKIQKYSDEIALIMIIVSFGKKKHPIFYWAMEVGIELIAPCG
jgi:hypothetical protein